MEDNVLKIVACVMHKDFSEVKSSLYDAEFVDSLQKMEIIFSLEEQLSISFNPEEISKFKSINDLLRIVKNKWRIFV